MRPAHGNFEPLSSLFQAFFSFFFFFFLFIIIIIIAVVVVAGYFQLPGHGNFQQNKTFLEMYQGMLNSISLGRNNFLSCWIKNKLVFSYFTNTS